MKMSNVKYQVASLTETFPKVYDSEELAIIAADNILGINALRYVKKVGETPHLIATQSGTWDRIIYNDFGDCVCFEDFITGFRTYPKSFWATENIRYEDDYPYR